MLVHTTNIESPKQVTPRDTLSVHKRPGLQLLHELRLPLHALAEDQRLTFNVFVHETGETGTSQPSCALIILWPWFPLVHPGPGCTPCKAKQSLKKERKGEAMRSKASTAQTPRQGNIRFICFQHFTTLRHSLCFTQPYISISYACRGEARPLSLMVSASFSLASLAAWSRLR